MSLIVAETVAKTVAKTVEQADPLAGAATVEAPVVRLEACAAFTADADSPVPSCVACGWLADDHLPA